jgi:hypothetical protein
MLGLTAQEKMLNLKLLTTQKQQQEGLLSGNYLKKRTELED